MFLVDKELVASNATDERLLLETREKPVERIVYDWYNLAIFLHMTIVLIKVACSSSKLVHFKIRRTLIKNDKMLVRFIYD